MDEGMFIDSNNFQFYFHEVLKPINEPEEKLQENCTGKWNEACL